jgi:hypothetical protein
MKMRLLLFLAAIFATHGWVRGAEPLETVREAFRVSSRAVTSGVGTGRYRHYEAVPGGDWQLKIDAELQASFQGRKYHIDLIFAHDEIRKLDSRRIIYDGEAVTDAFFTPTAHPTGAHARIFTPQNDGTDLARGAWADFPWDVTNLVKNVWDPEGLIKNLGAGRIEIKETPEGDLVGSYSRINAKGERVGSVRFECPRRFGFNLAKVQVFNWGEDHPASESDLRWKQDPNGLWYVTSLLMTNEMRDEKRAVSLVRAVMMYSKFEPNAKVDASSFTEKSLQLPAGTPIVDVRPGPSRESRLTR